LTRQATVFTCALFFAISIQAQTTPPRFRIWGISGVKIYSSDISAARSFYREILGQVRDCEWCERLPERSIRVNWEQQIELLNGPSPAPSNLIEEIVFATDNIAELRRYFTARHIPTSKPDELRDFYMSVLDPEGHHIGFVQGSMSPLRSASEAQAIAQAFPSKLRMIHAGIIVRDRAAEDRFYKDILGFHVYWHGGMKDDETNWVDMQVPDGTDWLEFMLNVPTDADKHTLGVMNHIALGVPDIHAAEKQLRANGWNGTEEPKIGRDGKWQLNLYDPDDTRVELMEFTPVQKPCCSDYTGPHPGPQPPSKAPSKP
jgi:catechol 2,3-dioxygenase-like lactoylglutathione lyase family enzyme